MARLFSAIKDLLSPMKDPTAGTLQIVSASYPPTTGNFVYSNGWLDGIIIVEGMKPVPIHRHFFFATISKWPQSGQKLPVSVDRTDPTRFDILWDKALSGDQTAAELTDQLADAMAQTGARSIEELEAEVSLPANATIQFNGVLYSPKNRVPPPQGKNYRYEGYEWLTSEETFDMWTTIIGTTKFTPGPKSPGPLSAEHYAQFMVKQQHDSGAMILENSALTPSDVQAFGVTSSRPIYFQTTFFPGTQNDAAQLSMQKIESTDQGGVNVFTYGEHVTETNGGDPKAFLPSPSYAENKKSLLLAKFPY